MCQPRSAVDFVQPLGNRATVAYGQRFGDGGGIPGGRIIRRGVAVYHFANTGLRPAYQLFKQRRLLRRRTGNFKNGADGVAGGTQAFIEIGAVSVVIAQRVWGKAFGQTCDKLNAASPFQPRRRFVYADTKLALQIAVKIVDIGEQQPRAVIGIIIQFFDTAAQVADFRQILFQMAGAIHRVGFGNA